MPVPLLHVQLFEQLRQWIKPKDRRHLQVCVEILAAIFTIPKWLPCPLAALSRLL
jgi:hypothetical protein